LFGGQCPVYENFASRAEPGMWERRLPTWGWQKRRPARPERWSRRLGGFLPARGSLQPGRHCVDTPPSIGHTPTRRSRPTRIIATCPKTSYLSGPRFSCRPRQVGRGPTQPSSACVARFLARAPMCHRPTVPFHTGVTQLRPPPAGTQRGPPATVRSRDPPVVFCVKRHLSAW